MTKFQNAPALKASLFSDDWEIGFWNLFGIWNLVLGI
jgi:hypothetical protein